MKKKIDIYVNKKVISIIVEIAKLLFSVFGLNKFWLI